MKINEYILTIIFYFLQNFIKYINNESFCSLSNIIYIFIYLFMYIL